MNLTQLTKHIYVSDFEDYRDRPRLGYIHGTDRSVLIDAGASKEHLLEVLEKIDELKLPRPNVVILTHWHWDHVYGLHACEFLSLCSEKTQIKLKEMKKWEWDDESMRKRIESSEDILFCDEHIRLEYPDRNQIRVTEASETFFDEVELDCGDFKILIFEQETDHSEDSTFIFVPSEKVLFVGDAYSNDFHHGIPHYTKTKLSKLIQMIERLDLDIIVHGHDEIQSKEQILTFLRIEYKSLQ